MMMPDLIHQKIAVRDSMRLLAAADIVITFASFREFSRSEVVREFSDVYTAKCLDRAMADLEAGGALRVVQAIKKDVSAGASYAINPSSAWHARSSILRRARLDRHGRGGCRQ